MKISVSIDECKEEDNKERTIIYIRVRNKVLIDELRSKKDKYYQVLKKKIIPTVLEKSNLPPDTKVIWSRKAGCGCGCSPGFLVTGNMGLEINVDVT
jgi:Ni,Fe-hydrogenase I small subunit